MSFVKYSTTDIEVLTDEEIPEWLELPGLEKATVSEEEMQGEAQVEEQKA